MAFPEQATFTAFSGADMTIFENNRYVGELQAITWKPCSTGYTGHAVICLIHREDIIDERNLMVRITMLNELGAVQSLWMKGMTFHSFNQEQAIAIDFKEYTLI